MTGRPRSRTTERERAMAAAYRAGQTLAEIGAANGITRERVRQILHRRFRFRAKDGGATKGWRQKKIERAARRDESYLRAKGCTYAQYIELRAMRKPTTAYGMQAKNAARRGISWELNLWQWWTIWQESGHWDQRGRGNGYVMSRKGDVGPYSIDNAFIQRGNVNSSDQPRKRSGLPIGVSKSGRRFIATRGINGEILYLGTHATPEAAHAAYMAADPFRVAA